MFSLVVIRPGVDNVVRTYLRASECVLALATGLEKMSPPVKFEMRDKNNYLILTKELT